MVCNETLKETIEYLVTVKAEENTEITINEVRPFSPNKPLSLVLPSNNRDNILLIASSIISNFQK